MLEETMNPLATPTRFLMENGEWNLTPSLLNEINPFDYRPITTTTTTTTNNMMMKEQPAKFIQPDYHPTSDPESDSTSSPTLSLSSSFNQSPPITFNQTSIYHQPAIQSNQMMNMTTKAPASSGRKRRILFEGEDAEEKRKKFLERNRVAAYKCRQKKKTWMQELEAKADIKTKQNEELCSLVAQLKEESMYLRNLLLTHGNCDCESVQTYLRKTSLEISSLSRRNSSFSSTATGLTPFLTTVINKPTTTTTTDQDYFSSSSSFHNQL